jgi:endoglucanase
VCRAAYERNLCPILWDTPGGHYNRETYQLNDRQLKQEYDDIVGRKQDSTTDGDINMDGSVNISDIVMLKEYLLSVSSLTAEQAQYADICKDGVIDCFDFAALRKMLVK